MEYAIVPLASLEEATYNPRVALTKADPEYLALLESLKEFGQPLPLIVNKRNNRIVGGHQRKSALTERGQTHAFVSYVDLDEAREKLLNIALNGVDTAEWNDELLASLLPTMDSTMLAASGMDRRLDEILAKAARTSKNDDQKAKTKVTNERTFGWTGNFVALEPETMTEVVKALGSAAGRTNKQPVDVLLAAIDGFLDREGV